MHYLQIKNKFLRKIGALTFFHCKIRQKKTAIVRTRAFVKYKN